MTRIVRTHRGYFVERPSRIGMGALSVVLGATWLVLVAPAILDGRFVVIALLATIALGIPAAVLASKSSRKRWKVTAVTDARQVAGGVLVSVVDARQQMHQLVVDESTAQGLAHVLTGRTGIEPR